MGLRYGRGLYSGNYKGTDELERHYYQLRKLLGFLPTNTDSSSAYDDDLHVEGRHLDMCEERAWDLAKEIFPDTAYQLLPDYRRVFDISTTVTADCRNEIIAKERILVNKDSRLNKTYYINLIEGFSFTGVTITEHASDMFIVADTVPPASELPHALYERTWCWRWDCYMAAGPTDLVVRASMEALVELKKPAFTEVYFHY